MSRKQIAYIHIFIWLFAIFANLPYSDINKDLQASRIVTYIIAFLYLMLVFYLFYLVLVPMFLDRKKITGFFAFSFLLILVMPFFGYTILFLARAVFDGTFHNFYRGYSFRMHMSGYFPVLTAAVFGSFFRAIINWFDTMSKKAESDKQRISAELDLLKSKLNPHFLFNTLNNIDSLIHHDPVKASAALIRLSDMMRYLTYDTSSQLVELKKEIEYINNYIELYRMRVKNPEDILFMAEGDENVRISPALFVPLIENAFKFASFRNNKPSIEIRLVSAGGEVTFEISNYFDNKDRSKPDGHSGYGIQNLRKRLALIYPDNHQLTIDNTDSRFNVILTINTNADKLYSSR